MLNTAWLSRRSPRISRAFKKALNKAVSRNRTPNLSAPLREIFRARGSVLELELDPALTHSLATVRLPLEDGRVLHIRKPSVPDAAQARVV